MDNLLLDQSNVCCRAPETDGAQLQEEQSQFLQAALLSCPFNGSGRFRALAVHAPRCPPRRKFSTRCSEVRRENASMLMVVVLSVQFKKTLASQTYRFATSCAWPKRLVTNLFGSFPILHVPVSCRLQPGISGAAPDVSSSPPAAFSTSAQTCFECSHI